MEEKEIWVFYARYKKNNYFVSDKGGFKNCYKRRKSKHSKEIVDAEYNFKLTPRKGKENYVRISIYNESGDVLSVAIHRAVAQMFIPNPENKPEVNHKDWDKTNNCVENLEWATHEENMEHARQNNLIWHPKGEQHGRNKVSEQKALAILRLHQIKPNFSRTKVAKKLNVSTSTISHLVTGRNWKELR